MGTGGSTMSQTPGEMTGTTNEEEQQPQDEQTKAAEASSAIAITQTKGEEDDAKIASEATASNNDSTAKEDLETPAQTITQETCETIEPVNPSSVDDEPIASENDVNKTETETATPMDVDESEGKPNLEEPSTAAVTGVEAEPATAEVDGTVVESDPDRLPEAEESTTAADVGIEISETTSSKAPETTTSTAPTTAPRSTAPIEPVAIISWPDLNRVMKKQMLDQAVRLYAITRKKKIYRDEPRNKIFEVVYKRCGSPPWLTLPQVQAAIKKTTDSKKESKKKRTDKGVDKYLSKTKLAKLDKPKKEKAGSSSSAGAWAALDPKIRLELEEKAVRLYFKKQDELPPHKKNLPKNAVENILEEIDAPPSMNQMHVYHAIRRYRNNVGRSEQEEERQRIREQREKLKEQAREEQKLKKQRLELLEKAVQFYKDEEAKLKSSKEDTTGTNDETPTQTTETETTTDAPNTDDAMDVDTTTPTSKEDGTDAPAKEGDTEAAPKEGDTEAPAKEGDSETTSKEAVQLPEEAPKVSDEAVQGIIEQLGTPDWLTIDAIRDAVKDKSILKSFKAGIESKNDADDKKARPYRKPRLTAALKKRKLDEAMEIACSMYLDARREARPFRLREGILQDIVLMALKKVELPKKLAGLIPPQNIRSRVFRMESMEERKKRFLDREKKKDDTKQPPSKKSKKNAEKDAEIAAIKTETSEV